MYLPTYRLGCKKKFDSVASFNGWFRSYKNSFNDFRITVTILLTKLFRMALRGNLAGAKKQCPCPLVQKSTLPHLGISKASKAENIFCYIEINANAIA